jgi:hypothetical protein
MIVGDLLAGMYVGGDMLAEMLSCCIGYACCCVLFGGAYC